MSLKDKEQKEINNERKNENIGKVTLNMFVLFLRTAIVFFGYNTLGQLAMAAVRSEQKQKRI